MGIFAEQELFEKNGYFILEYVLPPNQIEQLSEAANRVGVEEWVKCRLERMQDSVCVTSSPEMEPL